MSKDFAQIADDVISGVKLLREGACRDEATRPQAVEIIRSLIV